MFVDVLVGVLVGVTVGVFVGVSVGVAVGVCVGVIVGVVVGVMVGVFVGVLVGVGVGSMYSTESVFDALLPFPAASFATPEAREIVTNPYAAGVISAEYVFPLPVKLPAVPFVTVMSLKVNPVTDSSKVKVTGIGELRVPLPTVVETEIVGLTLS